MSSSSTPLPPPLPPPPPPPRLSSLRVTGPIGFGVCLLLLLAIFDVSTFSSVWSSSSSSSSDDWSLSSFYASLSGSSNMPPRIPHRIVYISHIATYDELKSKIPIFWFHMERMNKGYRDFWNEPNAEVLYFNFEECRELVERVAPPELLPYYDRETTGSYKSDICRMAAIYEYGGYYFDNDMELIQPLPLTPQTRVAVGHAMDRRYFQCTVIASEPKSDLLRITMEEMVSSYQERYNTTEPLLGPATIKRGFDRCNYTKEEVFMFEEISLLQDDTNPDAMETPRYPKVPLQNCTENCGGCHMIIGEPQTEEAYFYVRAVGANWKCK